MKHTTKAFLALLFVAFAFTACKPPYQVAKAKFDLGEYEKAIPLFQEALAKSQNQQEKGKIQFYIGESFRLSNRLEKALPAYEQAIADKFVNDKILLHYALALKAKGDYDAAAKQFDLCTKSSADRDILRRAKFELLNIKQADSIANANNELVKISNMDALNTEHSEYSPAMLNGNLVFASTRRQEEIYKANGEGFADLYYFQFTDTAQRTGTVSAFNKIINADAFHEASATFSADGKTMIFARSNSGEKREENIMDVNLYESRWKDGDWGAPVLMDYICNEKKWDGSPALSPDGQTLYFASEREDGYGGLDIYSSKKNTRGEWSKPRNLGKEINTPGNDMFPYVDAEGKLYFASDGHPGLGGLDLYIAERKDGVINIKNMGRPFSSPYDDFGLIKASAKTGYFTSNRDGGKGNDDIYFFVEETPEPPKEVPVEEVVKKDVKIRYLLAGSTYGEDDSGQKELPDVKLALSTGTTPMEEQVSDNNGRFAFQKEVEIGKSYTITGTRGQEYLQGETVFSTAGKAFDPNKVHGTDTTIVFYTEVILKKNEYVVIDKGEDLISIYILYDFDKSDIRPDAAHELDKLVDYLKQRPNLKIELGSHTDVRGSDEYNQKLSEKRAESAVAYIVSQGIEKNRIVAKGYGETDLLNKVAKTEADHQANRRTTVRVLGR
jgi:peptidoglycan-associated lipoprotein